MHQTIPRQAAEVRRRYPNEESVVLDNHNSS